MVDCEAAQGVLLAGVLLLQRPAVIYDHGDCNKTGPGTVLHHQGTLLQYVSPRHLYKGEMIDVAGRIMSPPLLPYWTPH